MNIRKRLAVWHSLILAILLLGFTFGLFLFTQYHLNKEVDESILAWAGQSHTYPKKMMAIHESNGFKDQPGTSDNFMVLLNTNQTVRNSAGLSRSTLPKLQKIIRNNLNSNEKIRKNIILNKIPYRIYITKLSNGSLELATLVTGRSLIHIKSTMNVLGISLVVFWLLAVLICSFISWVFVGKTLRPVQQMTQDSVAIAGSGELGRRIEDFKTHDEFGELAKALNRMLDSLEASYQTQKKFLADASHELRTPLTSIKANLDFLQRAEKLDEVEKALVLKEIAIEVNRMTGLLSELLMLARVEGLTTFHFDRVNPAHILHEALSGYYRIVDFEAIFNLNIQEDIYIQGDTEKLRQLMVILLDNALKYAPAGSEISVTLSEKDKTVYLIVADSGPGIPEAELSKVFERFFRGSNVMNVSGSGLGLAIARSIALKHAALLELHNVKPHGLEVELKFQSAS